MKIIPLTQNKSAIVDDLDYEWATRWKWCADNKRRDGADCWYALRRGPGPKRKTIYLHREIAKRACLPESPQYDHRDRNGLNNQRNNLRACTQSQNLANQQKLKPHSSRFKGVCWYKRVHKWMAAIKVNQKKIHLGYFSKELDAAEAYANAAKQYFKEFAHI